MNGNGEVPKASATQNGSTVAVASSNPPAGGAYIPIARSFLQKEEGLPIGGKAYYDPQGQTQLVSIGYGHQIKSSEYNQGYIQAGDEQVKILGARGINTALTKDQAGKLLEMDLPQYAQRASGPLGGAWAKLNDNQKAALISYSYNTGSTASLVKNGLVDAINNNDFTRAGQIIALDRKSTRLNSSHT